MVSRTAAQARIAPKRKMGSDPRMDVKKNYFCEEWNGIYFTYDFL
jgi:hypothetical protein